MKKTMSVRHFTISAAAVGAAALVTLASCLPLSQGTQSYDWGSLQTESVTINVEADETIYLVKYNPTSITVSAKYSGNARASGIAAVTPSPSFSQTGERTDELPIVPAPVETHHAAAMRFNANPPEFQTAPVRSARTVPPSVGDTRNFWVQSGSSYKSPWLEVAAELRVVGTYCRIWVSTGTTAGYPANAKFENFDDSSTSNSDNKITTAQAQTLADKFDQIYPKETAFFGYENGGGPGGNGGADGDPLIQILVFDIDADAPSPNGGTLGFFWGKDEYTQANLNAARDAAMRSLKTNSAEIFYLDAHFLDSDPDKIYSTLVHEFQHMILFNQKRIIQGFVTETWYDEMLSMLAEDMLSPDIGIPVTNPGHPVNTRIPWFNAYYRYGFTNWLDGTNVFISYGNAYAFGAYLVRNYGGAKLLREIATNGKANIASVDIALRTVTGNAVDFNKALEKFPEALLNTAPDSNSIYAAGVLTGGFATYNRRVRGRPWGLAGYNFAKFDIGNTVNIYKPSVPGPYFRSGQSRICPYGIDIYGVTSDSGATDITIERYANSPVKMYLLGKKPDGTIRRIDLP
jgi:hypothetical protein